MTIQAKRFFGYPLFAMTMLSFSIWSLSISSHAELIFHEQELSSPTITMADEYSIVKTSDVNNFIQCAKVTDNMARLACFDKVAKGSPTQQKKEPLDLAKTVTASLQEKRATPILVKNGEENADTLSVVTKDMTNASKQDEEVLKAVGVNQEDLQQYTPLSTLFDLDTNNTGILTLRPHLPTYIMPVWYSATPNYEISSPTQETKTYTRAELENLDAKMQFSFKTKLLQDVFDTNADVWFGYTQQSYWQVYNTRESRPFRSSDYQPEIFVTQPVKAQLPLKGSLRVLGAGLVHQSNGQSDPLSRSWNRAYIMAGAEWGKLTIMPRLWAIFPEIEKESDNPDIEDYMGYGDIRWLYNLGERNTVGGMLRYNPFENKGAIQIDYTQPITGGMKAYIQLFHGYGENIQDYNHLSTNIGVGVMFNDFLGL